MTENNKSFDLHQNKILFDFIVSRYFSINPQVEGNPIKKLKIKLEEYENSLSLFDYKNPQISNIETYNTNIKSYFDLINKNLDQDIYPTYYQYLALLFTEIFLDNYFKNRNNFIEEFIEFIYENKTKYNNFHNKTKEEIKSMILEKNITYEDIERKKYNIKAGILNKLVYWMATGSGKTIITAINILQYLKYNEKFAKNPDSKIILITPNETISNQHEEFLKKTGIFDYIKDIYNKEILIFEITKLKTKGYTTKTNNKKDEGTFDAISEFENTDNLVLVDEGHKSIKGGGNQKTIRDVIGLKEGSFTFEYSATFGQVINKNKNKELQNEYSLGLLFDYSFRYFYEDKYGKQIIIENVKNKDKLKEDEQFLENTLRILLTYTQQKLYYENNPDKVLEYNIENPLITIFGHTVKSKKDEFGNEDPSDILQYLLSLSKIVKFNGNIKKKIEKIINDENEKLNFGLLKENFTKTIIEDSETKEILDTEELSNYIRKYVFLSENKSSTIYVNNIKSEKGEIGLKLGEGGKYFGLISIGDENAILKIVKENNDFIVGEDIETSSLFEKINQGDLSMIIGSRKFTTGWNNYRISVMGLLNLGQGEGPLIIQILGRGVRLKGKKLENGKYSMKREESGDVLDYGQTLNIIGLNSKYLDEFINNLKEEDGYDLNYKSITIEIPTKYNHDISKLKIIKTNEEKKKLFNKTPIELNQKYNENLQKDDKGNIFFDKEIVIDKRSSKVIFINGKKEVVKNEGYEFKVEDYKNIKNYLNKIRIYIKLLEFLQNKPNIIYKDGIKGLDNLIESLLGNNIKIYLENDFSEKKDLASINYIENIIIEALEKYVNMYSKHIKLNYETYHQDVVNLSYEDSNLEKTIKFIIKKPTKSKKEYEQEIMEILKYLGEIKKIEEEKCDSGLDNKLCFINFKNHIFYPLLISKDNEKKIIELLNNIGLVTSEKKFIEDLATYIEKKKEKLKNVEIYLLRNKSKKGIGFHFTASGFYPDFILWLIEKDKQYINFIDPHGMRNEGPNSEKVNFCNIIKNIKVKNNDNTHIILNSFIVTPSRFKDIKDNWKTENDKTDEATRKRLIEKNVLLMEDSYYIDYLFKKIFGKDSGEESGPDA